MPVTTPTYGVFQGLYNGGESTSFIGLYANGAIGHSYQLVGIVFAKESAADTRSTANVTTSATLYYAFQTNSRKTSVIEISATGFRSYQTSQKNIVHAPASAVIEKFAQVSYRSQVRSLASAVSLKQATTSKRSSVLSRASSIADFLKSVGVVSRNLNRSGSAAEIQTTTSSKLQTRFGSAQVVLKQVATELRTIAASRYGASSLHQWQIAVSLIGQILVTSPIIFQDPYDTYTNQEVNTVSYAEPSSSVFEEPTANATFQEGDVSSFTERKWNNT